MRTKKVTTADEALAKLGDKDTLSEILISDLNKKLDQTAFALGEQEAPTDITQLVSTGSTILDTILTNGKWGKQSGWPCRRLVSIAGNTSAGKSLLANHALINTQKMGGIPILFDEENSTDISLLVKMGLKIGDAATVAGLHKLVYTSVGNVEEVFNTMEFTIRRIRELGSKKLITIVWDSIAATPSKEELDGSYDKEGYGTGKALAISKGMRKVTQFIGKEDVLLIFTNQLRANIGGFGFTDKYTEPGGNATPFHSSIRLRVTKISDIKGTDGVVIGVTIQAQTKKNKIAPPSRKCKFDIYFDKGIDDEQSWLDNLIEKEVIKRPTKQKYMIELPISGSQGSQNVEFKYDNWKSVIQNNIDYVKQLVIKANIIDYSNLTPGFDEAEFEKTTTIEENEIEG